MGDADRSSVEIKVLLKNLDPSKPSIKHKDRLRRLNKFRNYVTAKPSPEFYDDDYSLLLLGSESPAADDDDDLVDMDLVGLLRAAGTPSTDHKDSLKRSARPTISLLRYLCLEFEHAPKSKAVNNIMGELNGFAAAFCALHLPQLRTIRFEIHIGKGDNESGSRGGSKDDACHLLALILARHTDTDYETPKPLALKSFLPEPRGQAEFEAWLGENAGPDVRRVIHSNAVESRGTGGGGGGRLTTTKTAAVATKSNPFSDDDDDEEEEDDDVLGAFGKKEKTDKGGSQQSSSAPKRGSDANPFGGGSGAVASDGKPTSWAETQMASMKEMASGAIFIEEEREKAMAERKKADEEKRRLLGRDPLGLHRPDGVRDQFDLQEIDNNREHYVQQTLNEIEEEIAVELANVGESGVERVNWLEAQRQALLAIVEAKKQAKMEGGGGEGAESQHELPSILPTNPDFDPVLFLTLVHRNASYEELQKSTAGLSRKTDNQVERLQNLVRDNFALFIKCSEGIDLFADQSDSSNTNGMDQLLNRFGKLDGLAESCSGQARKSFKPLLDNTNEVRKVQSALAVLQRVAPLLQVPSLMRQHIENANFSSVVKAYRKVLVIDKNHDDVDLLRYVRAKAGEAAQDARHDLELILADETSSANSLLDAIRDLGELLELLDVDEEDEGEDGDKNSSATKTPRSSGQAAKNSAAMKPGTFTIDRHVICVRDYPPALACLFLQTTHFRSLVDKSIANTEANVERIFRGEGPDNASSQSGGSGSGSGGRRDSSIEATPSTEENSSAQRSSRDKRWKFEVIEARVDATYRSVALAKNWLPRLLQIGLATQEAERRRMARQRRKQVLPLSTDSMEEGDAKDALDAKMMSAYDVFKSIVSPALLRLEEHVAYCSLGCANQGSKYKISATFGRGSAERLRAILKSPLPPTQTAKCALDLAELSAAIEDAIASLGDDVEGTKVIYRSPFEKSAKLTNEAVVMIEQRVCIYSFDACSRKCSISASGSGVFDGDALLQCVQKLSDDLTRSDECSKEIEKGCLLVTQKCCEGLTNYARDRSDAARLRVVAECADALNTTIVDVVREVSYLTNGQSDSLEANLSSVISALERQMFEIFLESVKRNVLACAKLGLIEKPSDDDQRTNESAPFPPYLAASFLNIVRCRAQVERALRDLRRSEGTTYQFLALQTASDGVVENICLEMKAKLNRVRPQADMYSIHLQFLISTLKKYLSDDILSLASDTRRMLLSASSRGVGRGMGNGPEGLTALENLERLGRVYVMCLGE